MTPLMLTPQAWGGVLWTQRSIPPGGESISFINGKFIVTWASGTNLISSDGTNWIAIPTGVDAKLKKVFFANGLYMSRTTSNLVTSIDGTNWIQYPQALPGESLATDGSRLVTGGGKFSSPPYYDGYIYLSDRLVDVDIMNTSPATVALSGLVGRNYRVDFTDVLGASGTNDWQPLTTLQLPTNPTFITDTTSTNSPQRFYRGVLLP